MSIDNEDYVADDKWAVMARVPLEIVTCEQGTPEWHAARVGVLTASNMGKLLMEGQKKGTPSKTRREYLMKVLGERVTGVAMYNYSNDHMERGHVQEPEALRWYEFLTDQAVERVGFLKRGLYGCSPDGLVGTNGMVEAKTKLAHIQAEILLADAVPNEHIGQLQGNLLVADREWIDFVSYCPKMRPLMKRVYRDDIYLNRLKEAIVIFEDELGEFLRLVQPPVQSQQEAA